MKYKQEDYIDSGIYGVDEDMENVKEKIVKCRKPHNCMGGCETEIKSGEYALLQTGFLYGEPVSCYTCIPCVEEWLEESGQVELEDDTNA